MEKRQVTLKDVARAAGVSHQTVSRAINDKGEIDPETRRRVLEVARELRYRPSRFARGLVSSGTITVGLLVREVVNPFFPELIAGVLAAADERGWQVVVASSENDERREAAAVRSLANQVDVLIGYLMGPAPEDGLPLVVIGREGADIDVDAEGGVRQALDHLIDRGHRRIGMLDLPSPWGRREPFLEYARERTLPIDAGWVIDTESVDPDGGTAFERLRAVHPDVTAVLAYNDVIAVGAQRAARRLGLRVPEDCAFVGFDGLTIGDLLEPPLTSVAIDKRRMGELAVEQAERLLAGTPADRIILETTLEVKGSS
ncbi:LacI family DNA-binding transcriptional regulator [Symbioplanes lichenis]|uniref:LacI family DNA-binding transcriptional regulator n=1 Tax=Symbioplanes lichenis TaxID=1629072 RepID=UPI00273A526E|nr:LacI family DNA-binding transcriptional regulator [Actinoplanes lichenis]